MSLFASPSSIPCTVKAQGLFSSQTAFKKPTFTSTLTKLTNNCYKPIGLTHPKDLFFSKQANPVRILAKSEDIELITSEPVKKMKVNKGESMFLDQLSNNKTQQNTVKTSKLTIEDVFSAPLDLKQLNNGSIFEECFDDGSSLSFISSHPSIENLDEEIIGAKHISNHVNTVSGKENHLSEAESLVVKDNVIQRLSYLHQENILLNLQNQLMFKPFDQESVFQPFELLKTVPVGLACNVPLMIPRNDLSHYIQLTMHNQQLLLQNLSDKSINEFAKITEDGYDSDSYATRSTSVEQADGGESSSGEKSQKGASPLYNGNDDLYEEEKIQERVKKQKVERVKKQVKRENNKVNNKEKKGRSLNLKLDVNPKQLKVERRLNRLQLLRYQQEDMEEDEEIKKFGISELLSRANSSIQEPQMETVEAQLAHHTPEYSQAVVPQLGEESGRRQRAALKSVWNPENIQEEVLEQYFQLLAEILESQVTDQEAAMKLLTTFGMDISLALIAVRENKEMYSEVFRLKVKRLRRRGA